MEKFDYLQIDALQAKLARKAEYCLLLGAVSYCTSTRIILSNGAFTFSVSVNGTGSEDSHSWEARRLNYGPDQSSRLNVESAKALDEYLDSCISKVLQNMHEQNELLAQYYGENTPEII